MRPPSITAPSSPKTVGAIRTLGGPGSTITGGTTGVAKDGDTRDSGCTYSLSHELIRPEGLRHVKGYVARAKLGPGALVSAGQAEARRGAPGVKAL
jgi:hypothetical protein